MISIAIFAIAVEVLGQTLRDERVDVLGDVWYVPVHAHVLLARGEAAALVQPMAKML